MLSHQMIKKELFKSIYGQMLKFLSNRYNFSCKLVFSTQ